MRTWRYSRWDGSQSAFSLDAERALDALSELLMEGLSAEEALEWMRRQGFELAGTEMRVLGLDELAQELRQEQEALARRYRLDDATQELRRRLEEILDREQRALRGRHGFESQRLNEFLARRHAEAQRLSERIERLRDHRFEDARAGADFQELLDELERLRGLEDFVAREGRRFRGPEPADYATAQRIRERFEALERLAGSLERGELEGLDPEALGDLLDETGRRSLVLLRELEPSLRKAGYLRDVATELTPRAIRRLGSRAMADVYAALRAGRAGGHDVPGTGAALPRPDETRPFSFGDPLDLDPVATLLAALRREARQGRAPALPLRLSVEDLAVRERDFATETTTVLLLDMSWSMSWAGRFAAAKRVALALGHLIRTRFPRDHFFVVGFYTRARELSEPDLVRATWNMGDPFTNLQEGLMLAERLVARHPSPNPQVLVVTDGQPTAYFREGRLHVEWPTGFGGLSPRAAAETLRQVRRITRRGVTINTFMLDDAPELVEFVGQMTRINRGRAFFTRPGQLGSYLMVDYLSRKRRRER
jgi:uncharacterized protein with von Willebrand factor type A (vWA) domain